jgi:hypothetical protein
MLLEGEFQVEQESHKVYQHIIASTVPATYTPQSRYVSDPRASPGLRKGKELIQIWAIMRRIAEAMLMKSLGLLRKQGMDML